MLKRDAEAIQSLGGYALLGIHPSASDADLKRAYREQCLRYHPDKGGDTATFQELQRVYEKILDERRRGIHHPPPPAAQPPPEPTPRKERKHSARRQHPHAKEEDVSAGTSHATRARPSSPDQ